MAEAPVRVPWKTARKRSRQKKERVEMRNFGQLLIKKTIKNFKKNFLSYKNLGLKQVRSKL